MRYNVCLSSLFFRDYISSFRLNSNLCCECFQLFRYESFTRAVMLCYNILYCDMPLFQQKSTRQLQSLASYGKKNRDKLLAVEGPRLKRVLETLIYKMKDMASENYCLGMTLHLSRHIRNHYSSRISYWMYSILSSLI